MLESRMRNIYLLLFFILFSLLFNLDKVALGEFSYIPNGDILGWDISLRLAFLKGRLEDGGSAWLPGILSGIDATANAQYPNLLVLPYSILPVWAATFVVGFVIWLTSVSGMYLFLRKVIDCGVTNSIIGAISFTFIVFTYTLFGLGWVSAPWIIVILWYVLKRNYFGYVALISIAIISGLLVSLSSNFIRTLPFSLPLLFLWAGLFFREEKEKVFIFFVSFGLAAALPQVPFLLATYEFSDFSHRVNRPLSGAYPNDLLERFLYLLRNHLHSTWYFFIIPVLAVFYANIRRSQNVTLYILLVITFLPAFIEAIFMSFGEGKAAPVNYYFQYSLPFFLVTLAMQLHMTLEQCEARVSVPLSIDRFLENPIIFITQTIFIVLVLTTLYAPSSAFLACLLCLFIERLWLGKNILGFRLWVESESFHIKLAPLLIIFMITNVAYQEYEFRKNTVYDWLNFGSIHTSLNATALLTLPPLENDPYRVATVVVGQDKGMINLPAAYGLETADGYTSIYSRRYHDFWRGLIAPVLEIDVGQAKKFDYWGNLVSLQLPVGSESNIDVSEYFNLNLLSLANVRYILSTFPLSTPLLKQDMEPEAEPKHYPGETFAERVQRKLYRPFNGRAYYRYVNPAALDRFRLVGKVEVFDTPADLLSRLGASSIDELAETAYIEAGDGYATSIIASGEGALEVQDYKSDRFTLHATTTTKQFLVVSITQHPGWGCTVNDETAIPVFVYHAYWGLLVPQGESAIECRFQPTWQRLVGIEE